MGCERGVLVHQSRQVPITSSTTHETLRSRWCVLVSIGGIFNGSSCATLRVWCLVTSAWTSTLVGATGYRPQAKWSQKASRTLLATGEGEWLQSRTWPAVSNDSAMV